MHPHDQTSMEVLYVLEPRRTSGARYHKVTTFPVMSQDFRRRDYATHFVGESVNGYTKSSGEAKVSKLEFSFPIDE